MAWIAWATASFGATSMTPEAGVNGNIGEDCAAAELPISSPIKKTRLNLDKFDSCRMDNP
jgi:hypothetical protein